MHDVWWYEVPEGGRAFCALCNRWFDERDWDDHEECRARVEEDERGENITEAEINGDEAEREHDINRDLENGPFGR